jgi:type IV secretion system protein VirD4
MAGFKMYYEKKNKLATSKLGNKNTFGRLYGKDGFILSQNYQLNFKKSLENVVCIAPPGEHKTTAEAVPNLLTDNLPSSSLVIADPKGELYKLTAEYQRSIGRTPILYEPLGTNARYNILEMCRDDSEVKELAQNILMNGDLSYRMATRSTGQSTEWLAMTEPLLIALLMYGRYKRMPLRECIRLLVTADEETLRKELTTTNNTDIAFHYNLFASCNKSEGTFGSIKGTLQGAVKLFLERDLAISMNGTDFTAKHLRKKPIALYISYPEKKARFLAPYLACFYSQFLSHLMDIQGLPILFLLDEFGNIGRISNFETITATSRSREIGFFCFLQSLSQMFQLYGRDNSMIILNNLKTKVILPSLSDEEAIKYISLLCGSKEITANTNKVRKQVFEPDEIRRIDDDHLLIVAHNKLPIVDKQLIYFEDSILKNRVGG